MEISRWTTGKEILDRYKLQPFELIALMSCKYIGTNQFGESVGFAAYLIHNKLNIGEVDRDVIASSTGIKLDRALIALSVIDKEENDCKHEGDKYYSDSGSDRFLSKRYERQKLCCALTPSRYKTEYGINEALFYDDLPVFMFSRDEAQSIEIMLADEGIIPAETEAVSVLKPENDVPVVENQSRPGGDSQGSLDPRSRNSLLKVIAVAICAKGDKQALEERGLAGRLANRATALGLTLSDDTVKKILNQAIELLK